MATMNSDERMQPIETIAGDRRADRRYELRLDVKWKLIRRRRVLETGVGETVDFSSGGLLFRTERTLPVGFNVELAIAWPVLLHNVAPLQLVVCGRVVRSAGQKTAIQMTQHEFRTIGQPGDKRGAPPVPPKSPINFFTRNG